MSDPAAEFYQAVIDDHRRRPRNRGPLPAAHRVARRENPSCGDLCTIQLQLDPAPASSDPGSSLPPGTRIAAAAFTGAGCALSQASASLATVALAGCSVAEARALATEVERVVRSGAPSSSDAAATPAIAASPGSAFPAVHPPLGDLAALAATHRFPARHDCALLAWRAALDALGSGA